MIYCNFGISALHIGENTDELEGNKRVGVIWSWRKLRTYITLRMARVTSSLYGVESLDIAFWRVHGEVRGRVEYRRCLASYSPRHSAHNLQCATQPQTTIRQPGASAMPLPLRPSFMASLSQRGAGLLQP